MRPILTAFKNSPDKGRGLARDMRVRWALEEVGQPYEVQLLSFEQLKQDSHVSLHPFGQIPTFQQNEICLFESGAIVLYVAQQHSGLLPDDAVLQARVISWMFAALNTIEPPSLELSMAMLFERDKSWFEARIQMLKERINIRLKELSTYLGSSEWLVEEFSAADLLMVSVLRRLNVAGLLDEYSNLVSYVKRGENRPAFKRAFEAQLSVFNEYQAL